MKCPKLRRKPGKEMLSCVSLDFILLQGHQHCLVSFSLERERFAEPSCVAVV